MNKDEVLARLAELMEVNDAVEDACRMLAKVGDDEPVAAFRARDELSLKALKQYAKALGKHPDVSASQMMWAIWMRWGFVQWQLNNETKIPD